MHTLRWTVPALFAATTASSAWGQNTTRASVDSAGDQGNAPSHSAALTSDARFLAFESDATNLVPGDTNGQTDIFIRDLVTGATSRASVDSSAGQANGSSLAPSISADGRYVAFSSVATNLVAGDTNAASDVFVRDLQSGTTVRVSVDSLGMQADAASFDPWISADGGVVAFASEATNLVSGDGNEDLDVFVKDLQDGTTTCVSVDPGGAPGDRGSTYPGTSADGRYVVFRSAATNLVPGDTGGIPDIFVRDRTSGSTTRASVSSTGVPANLDCFDPCISADGRFVAFVSWASNLGPPSGAHVYVRDLQAGVTTTASVSTSGTPGNLSSEKPSISADGRYVAFHSQSNNLESLPEAGLLDDDVYVRDVVGGVTTRVSVDNAGDEGNLHSLRPSISGDGRMVAFESQADDLVPDDTNGVTDLFLRDSSAAGNDVALCFGDGSFGPCPCGNAGNPGRGCQNSASTGGALLTAAGTPNVFADTLVFTSAGERPTSLTIFLQGTTQIAPVDFGDGLRCFAGTLKRLYVKNAVGGVATAPEAGDASVSARSAALGDPIPAHGMRFYMAYYRDPDPGFCPQPDGSTFNGSNARRMVWGF